MTPFDAWIVSRLRCDRPVDPADLPLVSESVLSLATRLASLDPDRRDDAWLGFLEGRSDRDALMLAVANADPDGLRPDPLEGEDDPADDWPPIRLTSLPGVDPFPLDVLPEPARQFAEAVAWSIGGSRVDFAALGVLVAASAAIGGSCRVKITSSHYQSASLYAIGVGRSSDGKSPAFEAALAPIWAIQARLRADWKRDIERWELTPEAEQGPRPILKRIATSSPTCEALGGILRSNPRGLMVIPDETTGWLNSLNQYKSKGNDRQFWLSAWGGATIYIDRAKDKEEPIAVPRPFLSVVGGMTPGDLAAIDKSGTAGDGFTARLLIVYPDPTRRVWNNDGVHPGVAGEYARMLDRLYARVMPENDDGTPEAVVVSIDPEADSILENWFNSHQDEIEEHGFPESLHAHWGKLDAYLYRYALASHLMDLACGAADPNAEIPPISVATINRAIRFVAYLKSHARRVHHATNQRASNGGDNVQALLKWIIPSDRRTFSIRDINNNFDRFEDDPATLEDALKWMVDKHLIRPIERPATPGRGRPSTPKFEANPALWKSRQNRQNPQKNQNSSNIDGFDGFDGKTEEDQ